MYPHLRSLLGVISLCLLSVQLHAQSPDLNISGADDRLTVNIRAHITLPELACDASIPRLNRSLPAIRQSVVRAGRAVGFYQLRYTTIFVRGENCWALNITLDPGEPVRVGTVTIAVSDNEQFFSSVLASTQLLCDVNPYGTK